jgi:sulfate adenylyltransferase subunit 2
MSARSLLSDTEYVLRETSSMFSNPAVLWSGGKDSTALLRMISGAFREFPFRVVHLDNGLEFPETYEYMEAVRELLGFDLLRVPVRTKRDDAAGLWCCGHNKTLALQKVVAARKFDALVVGIRWDEHGMRGMERYFSPRDREFRWNVFDPGKGKSGESLQEPEFMAWGIAVTDFGKGCDHVRVHPMLHWGEADVWKYVKDTDMPVNPLYFSRDGRRFRSIGCRECSVPVRSDASTIEDIIGELEISGSGERSGRAQEKEVAMQRLRSLGYM